MDQEIAKGDEWMNEWMIVRVFIKEKQPWPHLYENSVVNWLDEYEMYVSSAHVLLNKGSSVVIETFVLRTPSI